MLPALTSDKGAGWGHRTTSPASLSIVYKGDAMIFTNEPTTEAWVLPPGNLLVTAVTEGGETCITPAVTVPGCVAGPGEALIALVHELSRAKRQLRQEAQP